MVSFWIRIGCFVMALGVGAGAFGAHGLKSVLSEPMKTVFETGVRYQLIHALGLFVVAWQTSRHSAETVQAAGWCFLIGIFLFCGSLYILSLSGVKAWGAVTPFGGLAFIAGWILLALKPF